MKVYPTPDSTLVNRKGFLAVNNNTFNIKRGEILGLLGPNGAGKSTTFNMLTMDIKRTDGDIRMFGQNIDNLDLIRKGIYMGLCP